MKFDFTIHIGEYKNRLKKGFFELQDFSKNLGGQDFSYLTESSSVYSSNIEGNSLDVNSFMNAKLQKTASKEVEEIENLISAYTFAQNNPLTQENFLQTHYLSSKTLLISSKRGRYRKESVGVFGAEGLIYMAVEAGYVQKYMNELFLEIERLLQKDVSVSEAFYYASFLHLRFVHIHPFADGNGRSARLLEKWFLASVLGREFWNIQSEKYYWEHRQEYYDAIHLGVNFYELDYSQAIPFLLLLPENLRN